MWGFGLIFVFSDVGFVWGYGIGYFKYVCILSNLFVLICVYLNSKMFFLVIYVGYESNGIVEKIYINYVSGLCRFFFVMMLKFCVRVIYV